MTEAGVQWVEKVKVLIEQSRQEKRYLLIVDAPPKEDQKTILNILRNIMKIKISGEKSKEWKLEISKDP